MRAAMWTAGILAVVLGLAVLIAGVLSTVPRHELPERVIACEADGGYSVATSAGVVCVRP